MILMDPERAVMCAPVSHTRGRYALATVDKKRTRDTARFAIIDADWRTLQGAFEAWLDPENFDAAGQQRTKLSELTGVVRRKPV